jgi:hypothetical protein
MYTVTGDATIKISDSAGSDPEITLPDRATNLTGKTRDVTVIDSAVRH